MVVGGAPSLQPRVACGLSRQPLSWTSSHGRASCSSGFPVLCLLLNLGEELPLRPTGYSQVRADSSLGWMDFVSFPIFFFFLNRSTQVRNSPGGATNPSSFLNIGLVEATLLTSCLGS